MEQPRTPRQRQQAAERNGPIAVLGNVPRNPLIPPTPKEIAKWNEDAARLRAGILAQIENDYRILVMVLGKEEADREWKKTAAKPRGRPPGPKKPAYDRELLRFHDLVMKTMEPSPSLAWIGKHVCETTKGEHGSEYGATPEAIAAKLRRLLKKREALLRKAREEGHPLAR